MRPQGSPWLRAGSRQTPSSIQDDEINRTFRSNSRPGAPGRPDTRPGCQTGWHQLAMPGHDTSSFRFIQTLVVRRRLVSWPLF
jgi:hypothetical protein